VPSKPVDPRRDAMLNADTGDDVFDGIGRLSGRELQDLLHQ
jgi:hypothetical protein